MEQILDEFVDTAFLQNLTSLVPSVGFGLILGFIFAIVGWLFGLVIRLGKVEV